VGEKTVEGELVKMDQPGEHKSSPNWDEIEIEGETEGGSTEKLDNLGVIMIRPKKVLMLTKL
jgi:hypothetical protein